MTPNSLPNPERNWRRAQKLPPITPQSLQTWLAPWPELHHLPWQPIQEGLRTLNLHAGNLVARIALAKDHNLQREAALLQKASAFTRTPKLLKTSPNTLLLEFVPVQPLPPTHKAGFSVGESAARIHSQTFKNAGFLNTSLKVSQPFDSAIQGLSEWLQGIVAQYHGPHETLLDQAMKFWSKEKDNLERVAASPVLTHADFKVSNIKWSEKEERAVIFDWEFAWAGANLFDLGQLLRWGAPETFIEGFEEGYRSQGGSLHATWRRDAEICDLPNLINFLARKDGCTTRERDVKIRIKETLGR